MSRKFIFEFIGTLILVYVLLATRSPIALGLTLAIIVLFSKNRSCGYFNPAITIALSVGGQIENIDVLPFCLSQIFGAIMGIYLFNFLQI
jgi:glycerol uptake facilitator-like aquaporin